MKHTLVDRLLKEFNGERLPLGDLYEFSFTKLSQCSAKQFEENPVGSMRLVIRNWVTNISKSLDDMDAKLTCIKSDYDRDCEKERIIKEHFGWKPLTALKGTKSRDILLRSPDCTSSTKYAYHAGYYEEVDECVSRPELELLNVITTLHINSDEAKLYEFCEVPK